MKTNCIIVHKVYGPYDGCFWCWNYVYINKQGKLHHLKFQGKIKWEQDQTKLTEDLTSDNARAERCCKKDFLNALKEIEKDNYGKRESQDLYEMTDLDRFMEECNEQDINNIATLLEKEYGIELLKTCSVCKEKRPYKDFISTGSKGAGGLMVVSIDYVCEDCYSNNLCERCGEYYEKLENIDNELLCEYCIESQRRDEKLGLYPDKVDISNQKYNSILITHIFYS